MDWGKLVDLGSAGAVIIVVIVFLQFLDKRDKQWQIWFEQVSKADDEVLLGLKQTIESVKNELVALRSDFQDHNVWERTQLSSMERKTQPRSRGNG